MSSLKPASNPFESLPDELLLFIFKHLSPFQRALLLSTCRSWNRFILLHTQLWNTLTIPQGLSLDLILTILEAFNTRSNFKLRQGVIETLIEEQGELYLVFEQLKKSASTLRSLSMVEHSNLNAKTRKLAMQSLPFLEALLTKDDFEEITYTLVYISTLKRRYSIRPVRGEKLHLKFYASDSLLDVDEGDLKWLSEIAYLEICKTDSVTSLHEILKATQSLLELPLLGWSTTEEEAQDYEPSDSLQQLSPISIKNLKEILLPFNVGLSQALLGFLQVNKDVTVGGMSHSLVTLDGKDLKSLIIFIYHITEELINEGAWEEVVEVASTIIEQNSSVENLLLDCPTFQNQEGRKHLDLFLEKLRTSRSQTKDHESGDVISTRERGSEEEARNVLLPNLKRLQIKNPNLLDWDLLRNTLKFRKSHNPNFQLEFLDDLTSEVIEDWQELGG